MWSMYTMEIYLAIKKNQVMIYARELVEITILSKIIQTQKGNHHVFLICRILNLCICVCMCPSLCLSVHVCINPEN